MVGESGEFDAHVEQRETFMLYPFAFSLQGLRIARP